MRRKRRSAAPPSIQAVCSSFSSRSKAVRVYQRELPGKRPSAKFTSSAPTFCASPSRTSSERLPAVSLNADSSSPPTGPARAGIKLLPKRFSLASRKSPSGPSEPPDRKSVVEGQSVAVRVDLGGRRLIKKKK